jgi:hypothetical protein
MSELTNMRARRKRAAFIDSRAGGKLPSYEAAAVAWALNEATVAGISKPQLENVRGVLDELRLELMAVELHAALLGELEPNVQRYIDYLLLKDVVVTFFAGCETLKKLGHITLNEGGMTYSLSDTFASLFPGDERQGTSAEH